METENVVLMRQARETLNGKWGLAIGTFVVYFILMVGIQMIPIAGIIISLLIGGPMALGIASFSLSLSRNEDAKFNQIFGGFNKLGVSLGAYWLMILFTILWSLLLIVPGIIAAISYSMTFYIIADDDSIGVMEAIDKSKKMMNGHKLKYFYMGLRFFGLSLLCILTLGIGFLWLFPYMQVSLAKFYDDINGSQITFDAV